MTKSGVLAIGIGGFFTSESSCLFSILSLDASFALRALTVTYRICLYLVHEIKYLMV